MRIMICYYSMYGHIHAMAHHAADGVRDAGGEPLIRRVPETLSPEILAKMGATESVAAQAHVPVATVEELGEVDGVLFGTPTRFGNMCGQMRQFMDSTGSLWVKGSLVGKPAGVFTCSATQHGGQESTILTFHVTLLHQGMVIVGLPYTFQDQTGVEAIKGGSPYGASTIAGPDGKRLPTDIELKAAHYQGRHLTEIAKKLAATG